MKRSALGKTYNVNLRKRVLLFSLLIIANVQIFSQTTTETTYTKELGFDVINRETINLGDYTLEHGFFNSYMHGRANVKIPRLYVEDKKAYFTSEYYINKSPIEVDYSGKAHIVFGDGSGHGHGSLIITGIRTLFSVNRSSEGDDTAGRTTTYDSGMSLFDGEGKKEFVHHAQFDYKATGVRIASRKVWPGIRIYYPVYYDEWRHPQGHQTATVYYDRTSPQSPRIPEFEDWSSFGYDSNVFPLLDKENDDIATVFYRPEEDPTLRIPFLRNKELENLSFQAGFKGYFLSKAEDDFINFEPLDDSIFDILKFEEEEKHYKIYALDNVNNASAPFLLDIIPDSEAPDVNMNINKFAITPQLNGKYSVTIPILLEDNGETGVIVTDEKSGFKTGTPSLYIGTVEGPKRVTSHELGKVDLEGTTLVYRNLMRGVEYKLIFEAEDNVGNKFVMDEDTEGFIDYYNILPSLSLPILPVLDSEGVILDWNESQDTLMVKGEINLDEDQSGYDELVEVSLWASVGPGSDDMVQLWEKSKEELLESPENRSFNLSLDQASYAGLLQYNAHKNFRLTLRSTLRQRDIDTYYYLGRYENRLPSISGTGMIRVLDHNNGDYVLAEMDNIADLYGKFIQDDDQSSLMGFYQEQVDGGMVFTEIETNTDADLMIEEFNDNDGDLLSLVIVDGTDESLKAAYLLEAGEDFSRYYLLPFVITRDIAPPVFSYYNLYDEADEINIKDTIFITSTHPTNISLHGVIVNDIASVRITIVADGEEAETALVNSEDFEISNGNIISVAWPFGEICLENEEKFYTLSVAALDAAGNEEPIENRILIDRKAPEITSLTDGIVKQNSEQVFVEFKEVIQDGITLLQAIIHFSDDFYNSPDDYAGFNKFTIDTAQYATQPLVDALTFNENTITLQFASSLPADELIPLTFTLHDEAGNSNDVTVNVATPATMARENIEFLGLEEQEFGQWSGSHKIGISRSLNDVNWSYVKIMRKSGNADFEEIESEISLNNIFYDIGLASHETYDYRIVPTNASGMPFEEGYVDYTDITVGNILPQTGFDEDSLVIRDSRAYFTHDSDLVLAVSDHDNEDSLVTEVYINGQRMAASDPDEEFVTILSKGSDVPSLHIIESSFDYVNGTEYQFGLRTIDNWENTEGSATGSQAVESSRTFVYDSEPPRIVGLPEWINPTGTEWGVESVKVKAIDEGAGLSHIVAKAEIDGVEVDITETVDSDPDTFLFELPNGEYNLSFVMTDRLGFEFITGYYPVKRDLIPPVINAAVTANASELPVSDRTYILNQPFIKIRMDWEDNRNLADSVLCLLMEGEELVSQQQKSLRETSESPKEFTLTVDRDKVKEGVPYNMQLILYDGGGNSSETYFMEKWYTFDYTSPSLSFDSWDLSFQNGIYLSHETNTVLPVMTGTDNITEEPSLTYRLLYADGQNKGEVASLPEGSISFSAEGLYDLEVTARDEAGGGASLILPVIYDRTSPFAPVLSGLDSGETYRPGSNHTLGIKGQDELSGVASYSMEMVINGEVVNSFVLDNSEAKAFILNIPENLNGAAELRVSMTDGAGNVSSTATVASFSIDGEPYNLKISTPVYYGKGRNLTADWMYLGDEEISHFAISLIGLSEGGSRLVGSYESESNHISLTSDILGDLSDLESAVLSIRAVTTEGIALSDVQSAKMMIDLEAPLIEVFSMPDVLNKGSWPCEWSIVEKSPLKKVVFTLEKAAVVDDELVFVIEDEMELEGADYSGEANIAALLERNLDYETIKGVKVRMSVQDAAGNRSEALTPLISIDATPVPEFSITDQGEFLNPQLNDLRFDWRWSEIDPESGIQGYRYLLSEGGANSDAEWTFTTLKEVTFTQSDLEQYGDQAELFLLVRPITDSGDERIFYSDGIILDSQAPVIARVSLASSDGVMIDDLFYTGEREMGLLVDAYDAASGIDRYNAMAVKGDANSFDYLLEGYGTSEVSFIPVTLPVMEKGELLSYCVIAYDGAQTASLPSWSPGIMYDPVNPEIGSILLNLEEEEVQINWTVSSSLDIVEQTVEFFDLESPSAPLKTVVLGGGIRRHVFEGVNLDQGRYAARLKVTDKGNREMEKVSSPMTYDRTAPGFDEWEDTPYVYKYIRFSFAANEGVSHIQWELTDGGDIVAEESRVYPIPRYSWNTEVDLTTLDVWSSLEGTPIKTFNLSLRIRDRAGNWSEWYNRDILFDGTAPEKPVLARDNTLFWGGESIETSPVLIGERDYIDRISLRFRDGESPLSSYRWGLANGEGGDIQVKGVTYLDGNSFLYDEKGLVLNGFTFEDKEEVYIAVQGVNRSGHLSEISYLGPFTADLTSPDFSITPLEFMWEEDLGGTPVYVTQGTLPVQLNFNEGELSPYMIQTVHVTDPMGEETYNTIEEIELIAGEVVNLELPFNAEVAGVHRAEVVLEDLMGQRSSRVLLMMSSTPPALNLPDEIVIRPGEELELNYTDWAQSAYGLETLKISGGVYEEPKIIDWNDTLTLPLHEHSETGASETLFTYTFTVVDEYGIETEDTCIVRLANTPAGDLLADEVWSGVHYLTGKVTVPIGLQLTIEPGTKIIALCGPVNGYGQELNLEEGGTLTVGENVLFTSVDPDSYWEGIALNESVILNNITVERARRGVVVNRGEAQIANSLFKDNIIGLHLLTEGGYVNGTRFEGNAHYGLKEDDPADPVLTDNSYENNGYDYYDIDLGALDLGDGN